MARLHHHREVVLLSSDHVLLGSLRFEEESEISVARNGSDRAELAALLVRLSLQLRKRLMALAQRGIHPERAILIFLFC